MDHKKLLSIFVEVVVFLFAAFSGFLTKIAPPEQTHTSYAVGISSFFMLILLLLIAGLAQKAPPAKYRKAWLRAGIVCFIIALPVGLLYPWTLSKLTYAYPPPPDAAVVWRVNGWELTDTAKQWIQENPGNYSPAQLELNLEYEDIWTAASVERAKLLLLINYTVLVLALAAAIFCLLEANFKPLRRKSAAKR